MVFCSNTFINKFLYLTFGTKDLLERRCKNLHSKISLRLDGNLVELPELESVVILSIPSWGGGVRLQAPNTNAQKYDDGIVEVFGLASSFHIGQIMIGLSKPIFLGVAKSVQLQLTEHLPVQADGEPWIQSPATINVDWNSHAKLLKNTLSTT